MYWIIGISVVVLVLGIFMYRRYKMFAPALAGDHVDSEKLIKLNDKNFKNYTKQGVSLVDFWAEWCQPCKIQGPVVSQLADELSANGVKICKMDVDKNPQTAKKLGIKSIPTIIILQKGKEVERLVGLKGKNVLLKAMKKYID
jgi:thioredoxin 1